MNKILSIRLSDQISQTGLTQSIAGEENECSRHSHLLLVVSRLCFSRNARKDSSRGVYHKKPVQFSFPSDSAT